mgnify:CR=1 FL=1
MANQNIVMYEEEFKQIADLCDRLNRDSNARAVLLVDRNGQFITSHGDVDRLDTTSLASLTAGNIAATSGLAKLIGEKEFPNIFHEGEQDHLHLSIVAQRAILVVMFDRRTSLGLVRLRVRKTIAQLTQIFESIEAKSKGQASGVSLGEISDDDIDKLFQ